MRRYYLSFISVVLAGLAFAAPAAFANSDKPLMTIRYNTDPVNYEQNLNRAVKMALSTKRDVAFNIVATSPETTDKSLNKKLAQDVKTKVEKVTRQINDAGVAPEMIRSSYQVDKFAKSNEVRIFVQ